MGVEPIVSLLHGHRWDARVLLGSWRLGGGGGETVTRFFSHPYLVNCMPRIDLSHARSPEKCELEGR